MLEGQSAINAQPFMLLAPAICVALVVLAFTFLGDGLREALDQCMAVCTLPSAKGAVNATAKQENPACPVSDVLSCHPPEVLFYIVLENRFFENPHEKLTFLGIVVDAS